MLGICLWRCGASIPSKASMRLTVYTDFSLRLLMYLALQLQRRPTIAEIATSYGISRHHLQKVAYELGAAGYITTTRGRNGGLSLARPPGDIGLDAVIASTEPDMALAPCFDDVNGACILTPACRLRRALGEARAAFRQALQAYTLADLVDDPAPLRQLLALSRGGPTQID